MNCKLPRVILETNELYRCLSIWVMACIKHERFDCTPYCQDACKWLRLPSSVTQHHFSEPSNAIFYHGSWSSMMWRSVGTVPTFRRNVNTKLHGVTSQESVILIPPWACHICIQRHYYVWQFAPRFTQIFSHDGRQHIVRHYSILPWDGIHVFSSMYCSEYQVFTHRCWKCFPSARRRVEYRRSVVLCISDFH
jgi:hypothetical protein